MINQYYKIKTIEKDYYCKITFKKTSPEFSCKIYSENITNNHIDLLREITSGDAPINVIPFIKYQIQDIYNIEKDKINVEEINYKLFNSIMKQSK